MWRSFHAFELKSVRLAPTTVQVGSLSAQCSECSMLRNPALMVLSARGFVSASPTLTAYQHVHRPVLRCAARG